jgi:hypothetical protein
LIKASGLQQAIQANAITSFRAWASDIFQVEIDLEHTNVHHELVVRQSTLDQISPIPLFALLHRPVFHRQSYLLAAASIFLNASDGCAWVSRRSS